MSISRNSPCSCGSGRRYKQCCGAMAGAPSPKQTTAAVLQQALMQHQAGQLNAAENSYRRVLATEPENPIAIQYLGVLAMQKGDPRRGEDVIRQALAIRSDIPDFHNNLGLCLRLQGRLDEALACYRRALDIDADYVEAYNNMGLDLQGSGAVDQAIASFEAALRLRPQFAEAHWNLGLALLLIGDCARGWKEYEWRLRCQPFSADGLVLDKVEPWQGQPLDGKTLLVRREQGAGDSLQFLRFVPALVERGAKVLLDIQPELADLARSVSSDIALLQRGSNMSSVDYYVNLMSLPRWLEIDLHDLPVNIPYLRADPGKTVAWQRRFENRRGLRVGLVWRGNPQQKNDHLRSCPLERLSALFEVPGIDWYSLQKGEPSTQLAEIPSGRIYDLGPEFANFSDTAAAIQSLDLVITVCTSVAHLAGALGKTTWVMLSFAADWRWLQERDDSPWYPTLRLFRQSTPGDWEGVADRLRLALAQARDAMPGER